MNDSPGPNRQSRREGVDVADQASAAALSMDALATDLVAPRGSARAIAFRALVGGALDGAYRRAAVVLGNRFEAEDAVHDAAERAWRSWGSLRDPAQFEAWFGRILVNVCRDRLRKRRRVAVIEVSDVGVDAADDAAARRLGALGDRARIIDALAVLSADERIAIVLRYDADLTVPEIARTTGAAEGTVKSRLHHAMRKLRARLGEEDRG